MHIKRFYQATLLVALLLLSAVVFAKDTKLRIHVEPKQAYVFVDGTPYGPGSRTIKLSPGDHKVGVYNYGFKPEVRNVSVQAETTTDTDFNLQADGGPVSGPWGRLQIESASQSAVLLTGKTPDYFVGHGDEFNHGKLFLPCCEQQLIVPAGTHTLTILDKGGHERWSGPINVPANERVIFNASNAHQKVKPWAKGADLNALPRFKAGTASARIVIAPVSATFSVQPGDINCGDSTQLAWTTTDTVERAIVSDTEKLQQSEANGNVSVRPLKTTQYDLQASGPGGTVTPNATVNVNTAVKSSLQFSQPEIRYRRIGEKIIEQGSSTLTWNASNAHSVSIEPLGSVNTSDSRSIAATPTQQGEGAVNETQTYKLTATNECGGSDTQTTSVRIVGSIEPIPEISLASVFFPTGHPTQQQPNVGLVKSQQFALDTTAEHFKKYLEYDPEARLTILGNTDERGSKKQNNSLSRRRADSVKNYLVSLGIPENKIDVVAQGEEHPLDAKAVRLLHDQNPNKSAKPLGTFRELVWAYNRRADLVLEPKGERSAQYYPGTAPEAKILFRSQWPGPKQKLVLASQKIALPVDSGSQSK